uniref:Uncharacterized protein n=1 Tax=Candidatus Kentrum sp. TC TaxID=2126339 RepID=A0A450ZRN2_9GAMM|nr:MAG: hypothetical protein BECKTC1821F_GA0114240_101038 [Candidatus Kentron sp. TC]
MGMIRCLAAIRMGNLLVPKTNTSLDGKAVHKEARSKRGSHGHS